MKAAIAKTLFVTAAAVGRPFGGIPPRRITHALGRAAFPHGSLCADEWRWTRNAFGDSLWLNPYYAIDREIIAFGAHDWNVQLVIERMVQPGWVCFDVGANLGAMTVQLGRLCGASGHVYAFEPVPANHSRAKTNVERNGLSNVVISDVALSDTCCQSEMAIADELCANQGMGSLVAHEGVLDHHLAVTTDTLDHYVQSNNIERVDLIKLDIQGAEPKFLVGAQNTLLKSRPTIITEVSPADLSPSGNTPKSLLAMICDFGYRTYQTHRGRAVREISPVAVSDTFADAGILCLPASIDPLRDVEVS